MWARLISGFIDCVALAIFTAMSAGLTLIIWH